jgi:hypothetical protein
MELLKASVLGQSFDWLRGFVTFGANRAQDFLSGAPR